MDDRVSGCIGTNTSTISVFIFEPELWTNRPRMYS